jgi:hypothetical protein
MPVRPRKEGEANSTAITLLLATSATDGAGRPTDPTPRPADRGGCRSKPWIPWPLVAGRNRVAKVPAVRLAAPLAERMFAALIWPGDEAIEGDRHVWQVVSVIARLVAIGADTETGADPVIKRPFRDRMDPSRSRDAVLRPVTPRRAAGLRLPRPSKTC